MSIKDTSINIVESKLEGSNVASPGATTENRAGVKLNKYLISAIFLIVFVLVFRGQIQSSTCFVLKLFGVVEIGWCK
ncbi:MAG: hypothetical protein WC686_02445 [Candidatus Shapirobacteria bacterium]|jgi:hypothetical protein